MGVRDWKELQHTDPHSSGHNSVSFLFSWAAQPGAWGPSLSGTWSSVHHLLSNCNCSIGVWETPLLGAGSLYRILSLTDWISYAPSYIIVRHPPSSGGCHKSHSFNSSTVKVIFWYSSTGWTFYLHRCISYFDSPAGSEFNIQHMSRRKSMNSNQQYFAQKGTYCHNLL